MIPGMNILNTALSILGKQQIAYYPFLSRTPNSIGQDVTTYASPFTATGSVQPVPRNLYEEYGLQFDRYYVTAYLPKNVLDVGRDVSGDAFQYNGSSYQCLSKTDWFAQDGWVSVLAVQVPTLPGVLQ